MESGDVAAARDNASFLSLDEVSLSYGGVKALTHVSLSFEKGRVLCLVGDNGAGKSSLVKIITGLQRPDYGRLMLNGHPVGTWSPRIARDAGIETVFQDRALADRQTVARNMFMGRERTGKLGFVRDAWQKKEAERLLRQLGYTRENLVSKQVRDLSGGERQGIAIARAMYFEAEMLILDEPTNALSLTQSKRVLEIVESAKGRGLAILFISHNIYDAVAVADDIVVLDRGMVAKRFEKGDVSPSSLMEYMESTARRRLES